MLAAFARLAEAVMGKIPVDARRRLLLRAAGLLSAAAFALPAQSADRPEASTPSPVIEADVQALALAHQAVVGVLSTAVDDARSADNLGKQRRGSGVVIDADGLVLTIGYLILEADHVDLVFEGNRRLPARVVAYDLATGFGLLLPLAPMNLKPVSMGNSAALTGDEALIVASGGADGGLSLARMVSRRAFSGYWEYHIDGALFTSPPRTDHSGAALLNARGELLGVGSLVVADAMGPGQPRQPGNMFVPIDLLKPILGELRERGASRASTRAWLGMTCVETEGGVRVVRTSRGSPAESAGLRAGDQILSIDGVSISGLEQLYKTLWSQADPQRKVVLDIRRGDEAQSVQLMSVDRMKTLSQPRGI